MLKRYIFILVSIVLTGILTGCRDDDFGYDAPKGGEVQFNISIDNSDMGTRGLLDESKTLFEEGELLHIQGVFHCKDGNREYDEIQYGLLEYSGHGRWFPHDIDHGLVWPNEAVSGTFTAYYIAGSTGLLNDTPMPVKLLSDYKYDEVPLSCTVKDVEYGVTVTMKMKRLFSFLTLTELREGVSDQMWFTTPDQPLNNGFHLKFNSSTFEITPEFLQVPNEDYLDENGQPLVYISSKMTEVESDGEVSAGVCFFVQPGLYHKFSLLYPRSHTTFSTYLSYNRNLENMTGPDGFLANHRYSFSILKSLGVIVEEEPEEGWDEKDPAIKVDVEKFLRAVNSGSEYWEHDPDTDTDVQILESTVQGTRMLQNVDFQYYYYDVFSDGTNNFKAIQNMAFDGNYHYIYHTACPLFYENYGSITNLGLRDCKTDPQHPIISCENREYNGVMEDMSYNGMVVSNNFGTIVNVRAVNMDMTVDILTSHPYNPTQETHNVSLLFGVNRGNVYDIYLSGSLQLTVENAPQETIMPRITIGGLAGQNLGRISNVSFVDDAGFEAPDLKITVKCQGDNGVYKMGGVAGNSMGNLEDIFLPSVNVDASASKGLESFLGGMVGEIPSSTSGAPLVTGCIVRGKVKAGVVNPIINLNSESYTAGVAGSLHNQANIMNSSVTMDVTGAPAEVDLVEYAEGGAFGIIKRTDGIQEGTIQTLACYGTMITGPGAKGDFAGISPYPWSYYSNNSISVKKILNNYIGSIEN